MTEKVQSTGQSNTKTLDQEWELKTCLQKEVKKKVEKN